MIREQRWKPSTTCSCSLVEQYDDADYEGTRQIKALENQCSLHSGLSPEDTYAAISEENPRWMKVFAELQKRDPDLDFETEYVAHYDENRELVVTLAGRAQPSQRKADMQADCDSTFGAGKVRIT